MICSMYLPLFYVFGGAYRQAPFRRQREPLARLTENCAEVVSSAPVRASMHRHENKVFIEALPTGCPPFDVVESIHSSVLHFGALVKARKLKQIHGDRATADYGSLALAESPKVLGR